MQQTITHAPPNLSEDIRWLYDRYAAMLLGYIYGVVQDRQQSEKYLGLILASFTKEFIPQKDQHNIWFQLRQYTREQLAGRSTAVGNQKLSPDSMQTINLEKKIFNAVYYHGKSVMYLARLYDKSEDEVRNLLKISIDKMRRTGGN